MYLYKGEHSHIPRYIHTPYVKKNIWFCLKMGYPEITMGCHSILNISHPVPIRTYGIQFTFLGFAPGLWEQLQYR